LQMGGALCAFPEKMPRVDLKTELFIR
jgi:hypothetical protein